MPDISRPVLVTGASRGLGRAIAIELATAGFRVWAGARSSEAREDLETLARERSIPIKPIPLDVADPDSINAAIDSISQNGGLYGVVNNAGITGRAFFEDYPEDMIRRIFDVNLFGPMRVIRRALPLLRAGGAGRIVNISSIGGRIGSNSVAPYVASKFGLEGFSESLAIELRPWNIYVSVVSPGIVRTAIWDEADRILPEARLSSSPHYEHFWRMEHYAEKLLASSKLRPEDVSRRILAILQSPRPRLRYIVGRRAALIAGLRRILPDRVFETVYFGQIWRLMVARGGSPAIGSGSEQPNE